MLFKKVKKITTFDDSRQKRVPNSLLLSAPEAKFRMANLDQCEDCYSITSCKKGGPVRSNSFSKYLWPLVSLKIEFNKKMRFQIIKALVIFVISI